MSLFTVPTEFPFSHPLDPLKDGNSHFELVNAMMRDPLVTIVNAARTSFGKEVQELTERDIKLIEYLYEHEHFSTFRHSYFTFKIKAPLFVFRQWWKHQIGNSWQELEGSGEIIIPETNWNEQSGRYTEFDLKYYLPNRWRKQSKTDRQASVSEYIEDPRAKALYAQSLQVAGNTYQDLLAMGVAREQARLVLPQSIYSSCVWTVSLQGLLYWYKLRSDTEHAQWEIQQYANAAKQLMIPILRPLLEDKVE